jgi:hypothetical protein
MTRPKPPKPTLDLTALAFPSDQITIKSLRAVEPELFGGEDDVEWPKWSNITLFATVAVERALCRKAFAAAAGLPDPSPSDDRRELILMLHDDYQEYGITRGLQHTYQLVRAFETAAAEQAKGRGR